MNVRYPSLFQVNTRVLLSALTDQLGRQATLDDVTNKQLDQWATLGFDLIWFLGVWQTGAAGRAVSASNAKWLEEFRAALPDFGDSDICGSCFAIQDYHVHKDFGGDAALERLRRRLSDHGLRLILDFVPNHTAPDHPWVKSHPEFYVTGDRHQLTTQPQNYCCVEDRILAYGRDPYFDGWPDTLQLNYGNPALQEAMIDILKRIAAQCDGVRCDMAMLVLPEVFQRTWGIRAEPFWLRATESVHSKHPGFLFLAEVYWDLEWVLQQQGFDYTYDKRLYDRLIERHVRPVREHLMAGPDFQDRLIRFLENHDEPRAAATFPFAIHRAAAIVTFFAPGLRFFHQGQFEGRKTRISVHLRRGPAEEPDENITNFYAELLNCLKDPIFREGEWRQLECRAAWNGNWTSACFIAYGWTGNVNDHRLAVVNYSDHQSQCYVTLPWSDLKQHNWRLQDRIGSAVYERDGDGLVQEGLYLDMPPWGYHIFEFQ
jgi:glycosidase